MWSGRLWCHTKINVALEIYYYLHQQQQQQQQQPRNSTISSVSCHRKKEEEKRKVPSPLKYAKDPPGAVNYACRPNLRHFDKLST